MLKYLILIFIAGSVASANTETTLAQMNFAVRNGNKVFGVQTIPKKHLYIITFGLQWAGFDQTIHANGYNMARTAGIKFVSPAVPSQCFLSDPIAISKPISGYINGITDGSNLIQIALKGDSCAQYVQELKDYNFIAEFKNVEAMQVGAPITPVLRVEILDLP